MARPRRLLLGALLLLAPARAHAPDEKFMPPTFAHSKMIACGAAGSPDGYADAFVVVQFEAGSYNATIAKRGSAVEALEDCIAWEKNVVKKLEEQARGK